MIRFDSITYRNILSVGQAPLTMSLSSYRLTALHGPSGSGKSLFLDALSFALFGRAFRDINKTDLINSINGGGLLVELFFSIGKDQYKIVRGLKPTIFEINVNGTVLNQESHAKDQQKYLEDQILKMNWNMFTHVVMLGAANYTPFMRLKPSERKKMVENILGIDVFSTMNAVVKSKISDDTVKYKVTLEKRDTLTQQAQYLEEQQKCFEEKQKEEIRALTQKMIGIRDQKNDLNLAIIEKEQEIELLVKSFIPKVEIPEFTEEFTEEFNEQFTETFDEVFTEAFSEIDGSEFDTSELLNKRASGQAKIKSLEGRIGQLEKHSAFYAEHDNCPTCSQKIDECFREKSIANLVAERSQITAQIERECRDVEEASSKIAVLIQKKKEYSEALRAFKKRKEAFDSRRAAFDAKRSTFEQSRRAFEERQRAFEARRRAHEQKVRKAATLVEEKKKEFEKRVALKRKELEAQKSKVASLLTEAKCIKEVIEKTKGKPLLDNNQEIARLRNDIQAFLSEVDLLGKRLKLLREAQAIIKDDGVKAEILKRYVPTLNRYVNQYLTKMGMFVLFELDQEFNDTIRSRHRDILSYANYSEGERQRIDLAVLLAWRHLAQAQSAVNTNLLILDEVLDSYLDQATTEVILNLMRGEDFQEFNIVIISHKDSLTENFDRTIQFQKKNNFTAIAS